MRRLNTSIGQLPFTPAPDPTGVHAAQRPGLVRLPPSLGARVYCPSLDAPGLQLISSLQVSPSPLAKVGLKGGARR